MGYNVLGFVLKMVSHVPTKNLRLIRKWTTPLYVVLFMLVDGYNRVALASPLFQSGTATKVSNLVTVIYVLGIAVLAVLAIALIVKSILTGGVKGIVGMAGSFILVLIIAGILLFVYREETSYAQTGTSKLKTANESPNAFVQFIMDVADGK